MMNSEISKAQLKKRLADDKVPGPGSYDASVPCKANGKDFPDINEYDSKRFLSAHEIDEDYLAELAGRRPPPPFLQGSPRFDNRDKQNRSRTVVYDPNKPVVEL